jgi:hypothetical protein
MRSSADGRYLDSQLDCLRGQQGFLAEKTDEQSARAMKQSSCYHPEREARRLPYNSLITVVVVSVLVTSCAVVLVGPYDEVTDKAITDLETKAEHFFAKQSKTVSYEDTKSFVQEAQGSINAIRLRAEVYGKDKNSGELRELDLLSANLNNLLDLAKTSPSQDAWRPARTLVEINFQSLIQIELAKKRSSGVSAPKSG